MTGQAAEPRRRRSWVGLAGTLTIHGLLIACVWLFTGTSVTDDVTDPGVRLVRIVPGDRETAAPRVSASAPARRAPATPRAATPAPRSAERPAPRLVAPPALVPLAPARVSPAVPAPEPAEVAPPAETVAATPSAPPAVAERAEPATVTTRQAPPIDVDTALALGPEDGRAVPDNAAAPRTELSRLQDVTTDATVAARAQAEPFLARREVFEFLLDNLEFATHVTRALRFARYRVSRTPEGLVLDDGWGAHMNLSLVQASNGARVIYARGRYKQTMMPDIRGEAVMMIEYETTPADGGREMVSAAVTSYVKVESGFLALLLKMASAAVTDKAELESRRLVRTFARVSRAIEENPAKVFDEVRRSPNVPPAELEEFRKLLRVP